MIVVLTLFCICLGWLGGAVRRAKKQMQAVEQLEKLGAQVFYDYEFEDDRAGVHPVPPPGRLKNLIGQHYFHNVIYIGFVSGGATDHDIRYLEDLPQLRVLNLIGHSDAGLAHLERLTDLRSLDHWSENISDSSLSHLQALTQLRRLILTSDGSITITDKGLDYLEGMEHLAELWITHHSQITDAGIKKIAAFSELRSLMLRGAQVTDAGVASLKKLSRLRELWLDGTRITDAGLGHLKTFTALETLGIGDTSVTDAGLDQLQSLTRLKEIWVGGTRITRNGAAHLQSLLPNVVLRNVGVTYSDVETETNSASQ
jgi:hypothetical protein